jgi:predicted transcriptional regulator
MRALSIRQPYAELILRGIKTAELRSISTTIVGERFYIYACRAKAKKPIWSDDLRVGTPPAWMIELAEQVKLIEDLRSANLLPAELPTGVIVGSAVIEKVTKTDERYRWHLADVRRATRLRKPTGHPQPVWFQPF